MGRRRKQPVRSDGMQANRGSGRKTAAGDLLHQMEEEMIRLGRRILRAPAPCGPKIVQGAILLAACFAWPSPGAAQLVEGADWSIPARPDWRTEVRYFDNPLCLMWSNGEDKCERDPETMKARCTIAPELRMEPYTVTCRRQNKELIMSFCDEWGVAGSAWCGPKRCMPGTPSRTIKFAPGIFCIKWKKNSAK